MSIVLDASAALAWVFERSDPSEAQEARTLLGRLATEEAIVPELWHLEVLNALVVGHRRGVITTAKAAAFLHHLEDLPIHTDEISLGGRKEQLFGLAREHELSAYDAAYLDLATRTRSALATFDRRLAAARDKTGVSPA